MKSNELMRYIGNLSQLGGTRHYELSDGWARNMRAIDVNAGAGLHYTILPDRGMDISLASFKGNNLVFLTPNGETHPAYYEAEKLGWLRTFSAGLLTTCGLTYFGPPVKDGNEELGLHGRYSTIPAKQVSDKSGWIGDDYHIKVSGIIEEGRLFGDKLRLEREISSILGENKIIITDKITNFGRQASPYTILYHMNLGYPMLSKDAELIIQASETLARDADALSGLKEFNRFPEPQASYNEQVFHHIMKGDSKGETSATLVNKKLGISLKIQFNIASLPYLTQWKMMGIGEYVLGLEPCNVPCKDRKSLREENILPVLQPGESVNNKIEISVTEIA
jgi:galactose mutarotase-like enzyme